MFTNKDNEPVGFESTVTSEKSESSSTVQTDLINQDSKATQKTIHRNVMSQTTNEIKSVPSFDYDKLAAFLKRVTPGILEALDEVTESDVLDDYDPVASRESIAQVRLLTKFSTLDETILKKKISVVNWSTNGGTLAVAYSALKHETWCDHLSEIKFYEFKRNDEFQKNSIRQFEINSCVTCLSYHPTEPSIMAVGLYNGDVVLWDLADEASITPIQICTHGDTVKSLLWKTRTINDPHLLITSSADGYIFIHKLTANFTMSNLYKRYKIIKEHNPAENTRPQSSGGRKERAAEAGLSITCIDFSIKYPSIFIAGTLCGGVYKCSLDSTTSIQGDNTLIDPVIDEYERFEGSVTSIKCCPLSNIFVSTGTNMEIRIYDIDKENVQRIITVEHTIVGLCWFTPNKYVISAYGADSVVRFYNTKNGLIIPQLKIESNNKNISCLDFNIKRNVAALADIQGILEIFTMSKTLSET